MPMLSMKAASERFFEEPGSDPAPIGVTGGLRVGFDAGSDLDAVGDAEAAAAADAAVEDAEVGTCDIGKALEGLSAPRSPSESDSARIDITGCGCSARPRPIAFTIPVAAGVGMSTPAQRGMGEAASALTDTETVAMTAASDDPITSAGSAARRSGLPLRRPCAARRP